jgi:hypothetical protein
MAVAIEVSFLSATQRLTNADQGRVLTFVSKFFDNPAHPSLSLERVQRAKSDNVWSARVSRDMRAILCRDGEACVLVYVDHHDDAYQWAASRSIARHDHTGALQIIELPTLNATNTTALPTPCQGLLALYTDDYLHSLGVPQPWLPTIRQINTEDELIEVLQKPPQDVAERLCDVAAGRLVTPPAPISTLSAAAERADQARNLFVVRSRDDLRPLLDAPLATWIAFLHPTQRKLAYSSFNGAVKVTGSAGTGKTVVAMHRARYLAQQGQRVLLTSYVHTLCHNLRRNLQLFCTDDELQRITISTVHTIAHNLLTEAGEAWQPVEDHQIIEWLQPLLAARPCPLDAEAVLVEWRDVIQVQAISDWEGYRSASRIGRDDVDYILETFPIVKRKDEQAHGEYRTKRVIPDIYDATQQAMETGTSYHTRLDPPPAHGWTPPEVRNATTGGQDNGGKEDTANPVASFQQRVEPAMLQAKLSFMV